MPLVAYKRLVILDGGRREEDGAWLGRGSRSLSRTECIGLGRGDHRLAVVALHPSNCAPGRDGQREGGPDEDAVALGEGLAELVQLEVPIGRDLLLCQMVVNWLIQGSQQRPRRAKY